MDDVMLVQIIRVLDLAAALVCHVCRVSKPEELTECWAPSH